MGKMKHHSKDIISQDILDWANDDGETKEETNSKRKNEKLIKKITDS